MAHFESSDAWLLLTFFHLQSCRLRDREGLRALLATADMLNHAILTHEELCGGVRRLSSVGIVVANGDAVFVSSQAQAAWNKLQSNKARRGSVWNECASFLQTSPDLPPESAPSRPAIELPTEAEYREARDRYVKRPPLQS